MQPKTRLILQIFGAALLVSLGVLLWLSRKPATAGSAILGEEVFASHDCSDCHLGVEILNQKREKKEVGLIRIRKDFDVLVQFLVGDWRHKSFTMISVEDRKNLIEYLRTLVPP